MWGFVTWGGVRLQADTLNIVRTSAVDVIKWSTREQPKTKGHRKPIHHFLTATVYYILSSIPPLLSLSPISLSLPASNIYTGRQVLFGSGSFAIWFLLAFVVIHHPVQWPLLFAPPLPLCFHPPFLSCLCVFVCSLAGENPLTLWTVSLLILLGLLFRVPMSKWWYTVCLFSQLPWYLKCIVSEPNYPYYSVIVWIYTGIAPRSRVSWMIVECFSLFKYCCGCWQAPSYT